MTNRMKVLLSAAFPLFVCIMIEILGGTPRDPWKGDDFGLLRALFIAALYYMYVIMPAVSLFGVKRQKFNEKDAEYAFYSIFIVIPMSLLLTFATIPHFASPAWLVVYPYLSFHILCFIFNRSPAFFQNMRFIYLVTYSDYGSSGGLSAYGVPNRGIYTIGGTTYINGRPY